MCIVHQHKFVKYFIVSSKPLVLKWGTVRKIRIVVKKAGDHKKGTYVFASIFDTSVNQR